MNLTSITSSPAAADLANLQANNGQLPEMGGDHAAAAKKFEALIATLLVKEMRTSLDEGFFGSGPGADTFGGWLDKSIGDSLAATWDADLAGMVKTNLDSKQARVDAALSYGAGGVQ